MFTLDARSLTQIGGTPLSYALGTVQVQAFLRLFAENPYLPASADEILHVMRIKENRSHYAIVCQVRRPNGHMVRKTQLLIKGLEEEQVLLRLLECRMGWNGTLEAAENRKPLCILLSVLICAACTALWWCSAIQLWRSCPGSYTFPVWGSHLNTRSSVRRTAAPRGIRQAAVRT